MISIKKAEEIVFDNVHPFEEGERMDVLKSRGYLLFEDLFSPIDMPPFRQSAMDGYALLLNQGKIYTIIDEVKAGDDHNPALKAGEAVRIFTGAPLPDSANAVVMQEKVSVQNGVITVHESVKDGDNIRSLGEQVKNGELALSKGTLLTPAAIGYLSSLGIHEVSVFKKPSIAIVVTGDELLGSDQILTRGKIFESNSGMLLTALNSAGFTDITIHRVKDTIKNTFSILNEVIKKNEVIIITGGISVGDYDLVGDALQKIGVTQLFYKVKQKPGKPLFFGKKNSTNVFALPGNPAAALSCFYIYVYPALKKIAGFKDYSLVKTTAVSATEFLNKGNRPQFLKAILRKGKVTILEGQSSAMLQTFALANALVFVPEEKKVIKTGDPVEVISLPL